VIIKLLSNQEPCFSVDQRHKAPGSPFSSDYIAFPVAYTTSGSCFGWPLILGDAIRDRLSAFFTFRLAGFSLLPEFFSRTVGNKPFFKAR
jgi:hypothetical protein